LRGLLNMMKLSKRLQAIAERVSSGARVADIGSDHALLPVYLVQSGKVPSAIAGELNTGPYQAACKQTAAAGLNKVISVRQGDGLNVLQPGEADTVTIAGMGGSLMASILEEGRQGGMLEGVSELVLQPNVGEEDVRRWLVQWGWLLVDELILEEDGHIYEVLHAKRQTGEDIVALNAQLYPSSVTLVGGLLLSQDWVYRMGPYLLQRPTAVFIQKWELELQKLGRIYEQVSQSEHMESKKKAESFQAEIQIIKEVLACIQMDN